MNQFGFEPAMFEEWGARSSGLRQTYIDDIINSDLYVGIFDKEYSAPTIEEYETARAHNIDIMIYIKRFTVGRREKKLQSFIESISDPDEGHVLCYFDDIMDLKAKLKNDLTCWIARIVVCKTNKKLEEDSITENEMFLALDSLIANKIVIEIEEKYKIASDFKKEFIETYIEYVDKEKQPFNFVIAEECLTKAIILTLLRRMRRVQKSILPIYIDIISCVFSGRTFCDFIANMENTVKAKQTKPNNGEG